MSCWPQIEAIALAGDGAAGEADLSTPGWLTSDALTSRSAGMTLSTPSGSPASVRISEQRIALSGVSSAGLSTTVQPVSSAGASFAAESEERDVPGHDRPDDADRLLADLDLRAHAVADLTHG